MVTDPPEPRTLALIITRPSGEVVGLSKGAVRLLGAHLGEPCWEMMSQVAHSENLPCAAGCVGRLHGSREGGEVRTVTLDGRRFQLSCVALDEVVVTTLVGATEPPGPGERPTQREMEVLGQLAAGLNTSEIARAMGIREPTVRAHVEHLRGKMSVHTRAALVSRAFRMGYLS